MSTFKHPYEEYEGSPLWTVIDKAIADLVGNTDIEETTRREYIVGYIVKEMAENIGGLPENILSKYDA